MHRQPTATTTTTTGINEQEQIDKQIQENITNWQSTENPLAPLNDDQMDIVYEIGDIITSLYCKTSDINEENTPEAPITELNSIPDVYKQEDFIKWYIGVENEVKHESLQQYQEYYTQLSSQHTKAKLLYDCSNATINSLENLQEQYKNVTEKTNYLHNLSEQLMTQQKLLKDKKQSLNEKLKYFTYFNRCQEDIDHINNAKINSNDLVAILNNINDAVDYLNSHLNYRESRVYKMKYESLLNTVIIKIYNYVSAIIIDTTKQVTNPDSNTVILPQIPNTSDSLVNSAFALYYGKFQSASTKISLILRYLEDKENEFYRNVVYDCQKLYFTQRLPILGVAVSKALLELKDKHRSDFSVLFRSCALFTMKVCQDEARCFNYFFKKNSSQLDDYLGSLCQYLYDTLRPCLITINHVEVLSELCGILKGEMLNEKILDNEQLKKYVEIIRQLLQDVEERLVFRTNVFFQHDLAGYKPSPGDLAYPDKLEQMENIALEMRERRPESRGSVVSLESQEVAQINSAQMAHFRSYTGNSAADLHGMWYPTVKRTLVCLSRLYFCLDKDTFQGLAQEALIVCVRTVQSASELISARKTPIDGKLFQIKHLLIIREQIAPFQVDFTTKELMLDFSSVHEAAVHLLANRKQIFTFGSNNALLEFLLEGTPKVKEYLIDSRKEIDKQLKHSCESFIQYVSKLLVGNILEWIEKSEHILKIIQAENEKQNELTLIGQDFAKPERVAVIISEATKTLKTKIPEVQRSMQLYLANRETEFILFRPIKNNIINAFIQVEQIFLKGGYTYDDQLQIACPTPEQVNILICSVALTGEHEQFKS